MEVPKPLRPLSDRALPTNWQECDRDCVHFEELPAQPGWGWCREPRLPFLQGLVRPGRECGRFANRRAGDAGPGADR